MIGSKSLLGSDHITLRRRIEIDVGRRLWLEAAIEWAAGVDLSLHPSSAVNVAEYSPYVAEAVEHYWRAYVNSYGKLGAERTVVRVK